MKEIRWQELDLHLRQIMPPFTRDSQVGLEALVHETLLRQYGRFADLEEKDWSLVRSRGPEAGLLRLLLGLLNHPVFTGSPLWPKAFRTLVSLLPDWSRSAPIRLFYQDAERREEVIRRVLTAFDFEVEGETMEEGRQRLETLDSIARSRVLAETRAAQKRALEIREALARKAAEEAASKYMRE